MKPGWKTSEFWLVLAAIVAGVVLIAMSHDWLTAIIPAIPAAIYTHGRTVLKASRARPFDFSERSLNRSCPEKRTQTRPFVRRARSTAGERVTAEPSAAM